MVDEIMFLNTQKSSQILIYHYKERTILRKGQNNQGDDKRLGNDNKLEKHFWVLIVLVLSGPVCRGEFDRFCHCLTGSEDIRLCYLEASQVSPDPLSLAGRCIY